MALRTRVLRELVRTDHLYNTIARATPNTDLYHAIKNLAAVREGKAGWLERRQFRKLESEAMKMLDDMSFYKTLHGHVTRGVDSGRYWKAVWPKHDAHKRAEKIRCTVRRISDSWTGKLRSGKWNLDPETFRRIDKNFITIFKGCREIRALEPTIKNYKSAMHFSQALYKAVAQRELTSIGDEAVELYRRAMARDTDPLPAPAVVPQRSSVGSGSCSPASIRSASLSNPAPRWAQAWPDSCATRSPGSHRAASSGAAHDPGVSADEPREVNPGGLRRKWSHPTEWHRAPVNLRRDSVGSDASDISSDPERIAMDEPGRPYPRGTPWRPDALQDLPSGSGLCPELREDPLADIIGKRSARGIRALSDEDFLNGGHRPYMMATRL